MSVLNQKSLPVLQSYRRSYAGCSGDTINSGPELPVDHVDGRPELLATDAGGSDSGGFDGTVAESRTKGDDANMSGGDTGTMPGNAADASDAGTTPADAGDGGAGNGEATSRLHSPLSLRRRQHGTQSVQLYQGDPPNGTFRAKAGQIRPPLWTAGIERRLQCYAGAGGRLSVSSAGVLASITDCRPPSACGSRVTLIMPPFARIFTTSTAGPWGRAITGPSSRRAR